MTRGLTIPRMHWAILCFFRLCTLTGCENDLARDADKKTSEVYNAFNEGTFEPAENATFLEIGAWMSSDLRGGC